MRKVFVRLLPWSIGVALAWQMMLVWSSAEVLGVGWDLGTIRIASGTAILIGLAAVSAWMWRGSALVVLKQLWVPLLLGIALAIAWLIVSDDRAIAGLWLMQWVSIGLAMWMAYRSGQYRALLTVLCIVLVLNAIVAVAQLVIQETEFTSALLNMNPRRLDDSGTAKILGPDGPVIRPYGWFVHPNLLGAYGVIGMMMSVLWLIKWPKQHVWPLVGLASSVVMIVVSFSRNAWMAAVAGGVSLGVWALVRRTHISKKGLLKALRIGAVSLLVVVMSVWPLVLGRFGGSAIESGGDDHRAALRDLAHEMVYENPWTGVGPSQFTVAAQVFRPDWDGAQLAPVHHLPLLLMAEWGVVGLAGLLVLAGFALKWLKRTGRLPLALVFVPSLVVMSWFDMYLYQFWPGMALVGWVAIIVLAFSTPSVRKRS